MAPLTEFAAAKVNLSLQIKGRRPDGYHEVVSVTAFADIGDSLTLQPGEGLGLTIIGPFAQALTADNLILDAARAFLGARSEASAGAFRLNKALPVAAGLGGGSADAAAALRLLMRANDIVLAEDEATELCVRLGADVRICLDSVATIMWGIGEKRLPLSPLPRVPAVLVNPGMPLSTKAVYGALAAPALETAVQVPEAVGPFADVDALVACLEPLSNDLEAPAIHLEPVIGDVQRVLAAAPGICLVRLSGSGPTVFGLFRSEEEARSAAAGIARDHPDWWVRAAMLS